MILVTGATGIAGSQVVRALLEEGQDVRAFVRDRDKARGLFGDSVELAQGDFADRHSVGAALEGVTDVFLSGADDPRRVEWETAAIDAAVAAGVRRIVKLSSLVAEPGAPVAFWDWHGQIEEHLLKSRVAAVVLRSCFFMSNLLAAAEQVALEGRLYAPAGEARIAMIDPRDVGAAAAAVLATAGHEGQTYVLTGPQAITYAEIAAALTAATASEVEFVDIPGEDAKLGMIEAGLPEFVAEQVGAIFAQARQGMAEQVTATVESLTGRPPHDVASFARSHARAFAPIAATTRR
jgi:uncharacterized protein YbjT (DUF2867 family)